MAKATSWTNTDAEVRKRGEQTGLDTLVVHAVNDECQSSASIVITSYSIHYTKLYDVVDLGHPGEPQILPSARVPIPQDKGRSVRQFISTRPKAARR